MQISKEEVLYVANLANINLKENEIEKFAEQIDKILEYITILQNLNTENIEPTYNVIKFQKQSLREDELIPSIGVDLSLLNAPEKEDDYFIVPKIIE